MADSDDEGQERERQLKILVMGDGASGKVSFLICPFQLSSFKLSLKMY